MTLEQQLISGEVMETFRAGFKNQDPIVIKFLTIKRKEHIINAKGKRTIFSDKIGLNIEHDKIGLTSYLHTKRREIYKSAGSLRHYGFEYVWCKNGKVLAQRNATSQVHSINTQEDINRLIAIGDRYSREQLNHTKKPNGPSTSHQSAPSGSKG